MNITRTKISGSWQRLTMSVWIMAALVVIGINVSNLLALLDPPISGHSTEVKLASQKWQQLLDNMSLVAKQPLDEIDLDVALFAMLPDANRGEPQRAVPSCARGEKANHPKINLPTVSGILRHTDIFGNVQALAIIDGQRFKENDRVYGFSIQKIGEDGVILARNGQRWLLQAPHVPYSRVQASDHKGDGP